MSFTRRNGRLCNQIIRNLAVSLIAEKNNLYVDYYNKEIIEQLGIHLFFGEKKYDNIVPLTDDNYFTILHSNDLKSNLDANESFFQTKEICDFLYNYLHRDDIKNNIIYKNPFKERYHNNNDLYVHIRLGDVVRYNPGINYYLYTISKISFHLLYLSTDCKDHFIIHQIMKQYPTTLLINSQEIPTIQFASTCKHIILSHGSFSAIIGYLSFFSNIYYPEYEKDKIWYGDMFSIEGWNKIKITK